MELNFELLKNEIEIELNKTNVMVLATSLDNKVTARSISIVNNGLEILFQTDKRFLKYEQISKNSLVALSINNIQIEGIAKSLGHPMNDKNLLFQKIYKGKHEGSFEMYSKLENEVVILVNPLLITLWKYIDNKPCRDFLLCNENRAIREFYDPK